MSQGQGARERANVMRAIFEVIFRWWRGRGGGAPAAGVDDAGVWGERRAEEFLRREKKFTLVARNWRNPRDRREEIDLVMWDGEILVFVEVKARAARARVPGYFAVNDKKKKVLRRVTKAYLRRLQEAPRTYRFDIVEIQLAECGRSAEEAVVRHFENVPLFAKGFRP